MTDFDEVFNFGEQGQFINTICEIPKGSMLKIEYDRSRKVFILDRVEPGIFAKPVNYGFIPGTLDEDGDALDTLILTDEPIPTGVAVKARVVGMLDFEDSGENDHKIVCVPQDDRHWGNDIKTLDDIADHWKKQIEHHFTHYKDLKSGGTIVRGWGDGNQAWQIIQKCVDSYKP